uniref:DEP domain-containing protein n=1 Tax=Denticeps clupeoides TaxID=299321 RepID=A0AAY4DSQ0_9TELE
MNVFFLAGSAGPFRATQLWQNIVQALQSQVELQCKRQHLRLHSNCFTGADAVDVVLSHLMQNVLFSSSEVSRLKATRLCQALMEARVFEPVGMKLFRREKETVFQDSSSSLYQFLDCNTLPGSGKRHSDAGSVSPDLQRKRRKGSRTISNPLAMCSSEQRVERLLKTINLNPSVPPTLSQPPSTSFFSKKVVEDVWRQQTLLQLLQIVDLPVLDCILTSPPRTEPRRHARLRNHGDLVISNTRVEREIPQSLNLPQLDSWLAAAADCLALFPDQLIVVTGEQLVQLGTEKEQEMVTRQKKLLFDVIAKYYNSQDRLPLLSGRYLDIQIGILHLLDTGRTEDALRASQLCLRLLEPGCRDELRRLLDFMAIAASRSACRLQKQMENRVLLVKTFLGAFFQNKIMTRAQDEQLLLFLMDNHTQLFKTPLSLIENMRRTLQSLQRGTDPDKLFCQQVSLQNYEEQREIGTLEGLKLLLQHISHSNTLPEKDRKRLLKDFQKHHPVVFLQHISSTF